MRILVAGASGFVGRRLCQALTDAGHDVRAMTRKPDAHRGAGSAVYGDVHEASSLAAALTGCEAAYYLVHSLDQADFEAKDAAAARAFGAAAKALSQIVYLGGLGSDEDDLSAHLRSRRDVERLLGEAGAPVTVLRAGIIVGHGGISWELTRQLVEHLPAMLTPRWVRTRTQPIAVDDVVRYLVGVLDHPQAIGQTFDIGGPEVLAYGDMMRRVAAVEGRRLIVVPAPLLTPRLSARWLSLVTDVDVQTGRSLIDSMVNEVVVRENAIRELVPFEPMGYEDMVLAALGERARERQRKDVRRGLQRALLAKVPRDHHEPDRDFHRRRKVVAAAGVTGNILLARSLRCEPASRQFYATSAATAATWLVGGLASGPLHLGREAGRGSALRRPVLTPVLTGVVAFGGFYASARVAQQIPALRRAISSVLDFADEGHTPLVYAITLANGVAEEVFFRGALYAAVGERHQVPVSTIAYTATSLATGNASLGLAASLMGTLFGLQRRATGGIQAPVLTHVTWSALMLHFLPPLFRDRGRSLVLGHSRINTR